MGNPKPGSLLFLTQIMISRSDLFQIMEKQWKERVSLQDREHRNMKPQVPQLQGTRGACRARHRSSAVPGEGLRRVPRTSCDQRVSVHQYISRHRPLPRQLTNSTSTSQKWAGSGGWQDSFTGDKNESHIIRKNCWEVWGSFNQGEERTYDENFK